MATNKRARKPTAEKATGNNLLEALRFIAVAQHSDGTPMQTHCRISNKTVIGFDGGITAGHYVDEILSCCPHTNTLIAALAKCTDAISITQLDSGRLSIKSGKFRALVPCVPFDDLPAVAPDDPIATLTDELKRALGAVVALAQDGAAEPYKCGVLLQANTAVATNGAVILEAWHGIDLPPGLIIPKASVAAIVKCPKKLTKFGYSETSATFFYEDDSFIKTQLFVDKYPNYEAILNVDSNPWPLPGGFYEALETITPFADENRVFFDDGHMRTSRDEGKGASYAVEGLHDKIAFNLTFLKLIREHCHKIHFEVNEKGLSLFFGDKVRGGIMKLNI